VCLTKIPKNESGIRGERLGALTAATPKCLLPINGTPLLQIWLEHLERSGIDEVLINTHWLHELLANRQWAGQEPFFIIYGDNLTRFDLRKMLDFHGRQRQPLTIRIYRRADAKRAGIVCLDENDIVIDFEEKPEKPKSDVGAGGIYIADNRIFDYYPKQVDNRSSLALDLSQHVLPRLVGKMKAYDSGEFSMDIGTPESLAEARGHWLQRMHGET
jgi:mannose-1-phosphate guanylyltransferase